MVGITRGGLVPACMISQYLGVRMETLKVSLRDDNEPESNLWMAEDAFGYHRTDDLPGCSNPALRKNILIVDDINDSGATINWIREDWPNGCMPDDPAWGEIWDENVRIAVLVDNQASRAETVVRYSAMEINKQEQDVWIDFPWETWWRQ